MHAISLSQELLYYVKLREDTKSIEEQLKLLDDGDLHNQLDSDQKKVIFWVNIYNAYFQIVVDDNPGIFEKKNDLFKGKHFIIAGQVMSLDDVEKWNAA